MRLLAPSTLAPALVAAIVALGGCGGPVPSQVVREQIATLEGARLRPEDVEVQRIVQQTSSRAVAEFTVQMAGEYARNADGDWELVSVRIGDNDWIDLAQLSSALARMRTDETESDLRTLADGIDAWQRANGSLPVLTGVDTLPELLFPQYVSELLPDDAWGEPFIYDVSDGTYSLRSRGPDRQADTADDIVVSGPASQ